MADEVQETNLDEVEVDEDGNLRRSVVHDEDDSQQPFNTGGEDHTANAYNSDDGLSPRERWILTKRLSEKGRYSSHGTAKESVGMMAVENENRDATSDSSDSYLGLAPYPELVVATAAANNSQVRFASPQPDVGPGHELHDIELSVLDSSPTAAVQDVDSAERGEQPRSSAIKHECSVQGLLDLVITFFTKSSPQKLAIFAAVVAVIIGIMLLVGLLPASFVYVEYYELALAKNRITGRVNRDHVYHSGCYLLMPNIELVRFQRTAHILDVKVDMSTSDELAFYLGISLQYFIKPDELGLLHQEYEHNYRDIVEGMVVSTLKNEGVRFSLDDYRLRRLVVEKDLKDAVSYRLGGDCCPVCCLKYCRVDVDCHSCHLPGHCESRGIHMEMRYFQMGVIDVPNDVAERYLRKTLLQVETEKELYIQQHAVETKISQLEQQKILSSAAEIRENATSTASKMRMMSEASYEKDIQGAYIHALKKFYQRLNITDLDHKLSIMYIRALEDTADNLYNLDYEKYTSFSSP